MPLNLDDDKETIVMQGFAQKKTRMFFVYNEREICLFSNGNFAYKRKNHSEQIKKTIMPKDILNLTRKNNILTIHANYTKTEDTPENTFIFRFASAIESYEWFKAIENHRMAF